MKPQAFEFVRFQIADIAKDFGGYVNYANTSAKRGEQAGCKTLAIYGLVSKKLKIECSTIPDAMLDRIADHFDTGYGGFEFDRMKGFKERTSFLERRSGKVRGMYKYHQFPQKVPATALIYWFRLLDYDKETSCWVQSTDERTEWFESFLNRKYGKITINWGVRITLPKEMSLTQKQVDQEKEDKWPNGQDVKIIGQKPERTGSRRKAPRPQSNYSET